MKTGENNMENTKVYAIMMTPETSALLDAIAEKARRTRSAMILTLIEEEAKRQAETKQVEYAARPE